MTATAEPFVPKESKGLSGFVVTVLLPLGIGERIVNTNIPSSLEGDAVSSSDVEQAVNFTRALLKMVAESLPRPKSQKTGPKGHNQILAWAGLDASELTNLKKELHGNIKRSRKIAFKIMKLFPAVRDDQDGETESLLQLESEMSIHDFDRASPSSNLQFVQRYLNYLASSNPNRKSEMVFLINVCQRLSLLNTVSQTSTSKIGRFQNLWPQSWRTGSLLLVTLALVLSVPTVFFWQKSKQATASVLVSEPLVSDSIITKAEAAQRLDVLWSNGTGFAAKGDDAMYFTSMKSAYELASEVFGPESLEFARASNHMVGAYETTGHRDEAITVSRNAWKLFRRILGDKSLDALIEQVNLGARLSRKSSVSDKSEARGLLSDAIAKYDEAGDRPDMRLGHAHALEAYSIYFEGNGDLPEAVTQSEKAVTMVETANVIDRINRAWIIANHAEMLHRDGQCAAAVAMYQRAIEAYKEAKIPITQRDYAVSLSQVALGC